MFALIAVICFLLALLKVNLGELNLTILGLLFIGLHLLVGTAFLPTFTVRRRD